MQPDQRVVQKTVGKSNQEFNGSNMKQYEFSQRYGGYSEPIQEKESENAQSLERFSNMSKVVSVSENNSQYDFLQHVTSIKDRQSNVTAKEGACLESRPL